ncbi:alpha-galactosidase [Lapidilactobacillus mulanensis]|uniref:Alpha-galactosidase n=1 Tax=Lapidilactobacillus mulanensis TaxID=2485999 RepID=A0ABW4DN23_9LACO|nr:alpha-galactosidase [Lapidilactobacillus mulanensis]
MIDITSENVFYLHNEKISYLFYVMQNGQLGHLYFGQKLDNLTDDDVSYFLEQNSKSAGTVKYSPQSGNFNLSDRAQEYPVYGSSDFKQGAIDIYHEDEPWYLDFKYDHYEIKNTKDRDLAHPASYAIGEQESETLIVTLFDQEHQLQLNEYFTIFHDQSVIARSQKVINLGKETVQIHSMMSGALDLPDADYKFVSLDGAWLKERHINTRNLEQGTVSVSSLKGASGHQHNPFIALVKDQELNYGNVYGANIIYSGNFLSQVEVDEWERARVLIGINPEYFDWQLNPQAEFKTPEAILSFSNAGINGLISTSQDFTTKHIIDRKWKKQERPIIFNNWEATYFDFNEAKLLSLARDAKDLGMECFVVDDGWFGHRDTDRTSLGDWQVDQNKFPNGIGAFAEQIHAMDLELGIWFEPEMVSPDTKLYLEHPDWIVRHPYSRTSIGRGQYVLDFANPDVVAAIYAQIKPVIEETRLDYIKWDMNRNITEAYSAYLKAEKRPQTEFFHCYIMGVYTLYRQILTDFPNLLIEGCAGGGGRYDLGILFYSPQIWPSDDSDAVERLSILSGTTVAYPLSTFSNHVSAVPNDQVKRITPLQMRQNVCDFGPLGYELDITQLSDEDREAIKQNIIFYKKNRQLLVNGHFQQLLTVDPHADTVSWGVYNDDRSDIMIGFYRKLAEPNQGVLHYFKIPFIDGTREYQIVGQKVVSGQLLQNFGLREPYQFDGVNDDTAQVSGDFQSYIYHLRAV